jgi:hypothetical protein
VAGQAASGSLDSPSWFAGSGTNGDS